MEVVGLVLAVVPIVSAAAKHWDHVYRTGRTVLSRRHYDAAATDDYFGIHCDLALLDVNLRSLVARLPDLSDDEKTKLLETDLQLQTSIWTSPHVESALNKHLGTVDTRLAVTNCLRTICGILEEIVSDRTFGLRQPDLVATAHDQPRPIYTKLERLREHSGHHRDTFFRRLYFTTHAGRRRRAQRRLKDLVAIFEKLVAEKGSFRLAQESDVAYTASPVKTGPPPDPRHRSLIHKVYDAMESKWNCNCASRHRAKMCLKRRFDTFDNDSIASLDILISVKDNSMRDWWHQGCVVLDPEPQSPRVPARKVTFANDGQSRRRRSSASLSQKTLVENKICELARRARQNGVRLELMYDSVSLWQIRSQQKHEDFSNKEDVKTLRQILERSKAARTGVSNTAQDRISLKDRRYLAVLLARSLLDFSESCWIRESWSKDDISFLMRDVKRPYLTTDFRTAVPGQDEGQAESQTGDPLLALHPCLPLLDLGILLLELQEDVGFIEDRVDNDDLVVGQCKENSNVLTAQSWSMLDELEDHVDGGNASDYVTAVRACLKCDWISEKDEACNLSNDDFRMWIYNHVVVPLERNLVRGWNITVMDE